MSLRHRCSHYGTDSSRPNLVQFVSVEATWRQVGVLSAGFTANTLTVWLISRSIAFLRDRSGNHPRRKLGASPKDRPPVSPLFPSGRIASVLANPGSRSPGLGTCQQYCALEG